MKPRTIFEVGSDKPALILFRPDANGGLWDSGISALIDALEEDLDVFVTCVGSGRGAMGMSDAAAAARFMGCGSLVVISLEGDPPRREEINGASEGTLLKAVSIGSEWTASAVARAYRQACRSELRAA
jgi:hypothetical protein